MNGKNRPQFLRKCVFFVTKILDDLAYYGSHGPPRACSHKRANKLPGVSSLEPDFRPNPSTRSRSGGSRSYVIRRENWSFLTFEWRMGYRLLQFYYIKRTCIDLGTLPNERPCPGHYSRPKNYWNPWPGAWERQFFSGDSCLPRPSSYYPGTCCS